METIENVGLLAITLLGIVVLCEHLIRVWTREADRRHWEQVRARLDESRW